MALGTDHLDQTGLAVVINEVWSSRVNDFYRAKLVASKFFLDMSEEVASEGDILHIPNTSEPSANTKSNGAEVTLQNPTETGVDLTVTTWKESSKLIEDREASLVINSFNTQKRLVSGLAYACAKDYDSAILGLYSGLSNSVNDSASDVADADILEAIATLDQNDIPAEDRMFFFYPTVFWQDLQTVAKYYDASAFGGNTAVKTGTMPTLYGIPVTVTTQVPITSTTFVHNLLAHKDAFVHASKSLNGEREGGVRMQANYFQNYLGTLMTADVVYGVAENIDEGAVEIASQK